MYHDILVPTDGSAASEVAVDHAVALAATHDARLHALYVVDEGSYPPLEMESALVVEALREEGQSAVQSVEDAAREADVEVRTSVVEGTVPEEILDYADVADVDLIVMGTHGRRGLDRYLLGSVAERVVRSASVPVLTVRQGAGAESDSSSAE